MNTTTDLDNLFDEWENAVDGHQDKFIRDVIICEERWGLTPMETFKESLILARQKLIGQLTPAA